MDLHTFQKYGWASIGLFVVIILFVTVCSGPSKPVKFVDKADDLCKSLDSKVLYNNETKKVIICE